MKLYFGGVNSQCSCFQSVRLGVPKNLVNKAEGRLYVRNIEVNEQLLLELLGSWDQLSQEHANPERYRAVQESAAVDGLLLLELPQSLRF